MAEGRKVVREGSRVRVEGVWDAVCDDGWDASQRALAAAIAHVRREPVDFDELLVASGDAFAAVSSDVYQDVTYLAAGNDIMGQASRYYGFDATWAFPTSFEDARAALGREIDAGRPVPAGGAAQPHGCPPWGVVAGYDADATKLLLAGYGPSGGTRWHDVRGDCGSEATGPWNGRVRGQLAQRNAFWLDRPLFLLGPQAPPTSSVTRRLAALRTTCDAMHAPPHRIDYWGGVTYYMGIGALTHLADSLAGLDCPAVEESPTPDGAYDWWNVYGVLMTTTDMVMRGRAAAARVFRAWAEEAPELRALGDCVPLLEASAEAGAALFDDLHEDDGVFHGEPWRVHAAASFGLVAGHDRRCAEIMSTVEASAHSSAA
jgi:hypothetical protein